MKTRVVRGAHADRSFDLEFWQEQGESAIFNAAWDMMLLVEGSTISAKHYVDLLRSFNAEGVHYLIVGGYAVMKYTEPRFTKDLDLWVRASVTNAYKVYSSLVTFGAPLTHDGVKANDFTHALYTYQIGVAPVRIDIITTVDGVEFADAWPHRVEGKLFDVPVHFISIDDLIRNKEASGHARDVEDLRHIRDRRKR